MLSKVWDLVTQKSFDVTFKYQHRSRDKIFVECVLKRVYFKALGVRSLASDEVEALERAEKLLVQVIELEKKIGKCIESPDLEAQKLEGGYTRKVVAKDTYQDEVCDILVEFRRYGMTYNITGVNRIDENGFYWHEEPFLEIDPHEIKKVENGNGKYGNLLPLEKYLKPGQELYEWDNMGFLSGSAGWVIVENGKSIKHKMTCMS